MKLNIDGEIVEIDDEVVRGYVAELDGEEAEEPEGSRYVFGIHVTHTRELKEMGEDIAAFMATVGEATFDIQVSVNAKLEAPEEFKDKVMGFQLEPAVGFAVPTQDDYDEEDDE